MLLLESSLWVLWQATAGKHIIIQTDIIYVAITSKIMPYQAGLSQ
jgi:hypothetical protein